MSTIVLLDTGPLGMVTNPRATPENLACNMWMVGLLRRGVRVFVPEIADYEVRRELLRANKITGLRQLDALKATVGYVPITTETMLQAAAFWAQARRQGQPTASDHALDGDVILAAQATLLEQQGDTVSVATLNVGHLSRFVTADHWRNIMPNVE